MANSPLFLGFQPAAIDFSMVYQDVADRGRMDMQAAAMGARSAGQGKRSQFEYKGEAAWWADSARKEQEAMQGIQDLLAAQVPATDERYAQYGQQIAEAQNMVVNEFRGQQQEKFNQFRKSTEGKNDELYLGANGAPILRDDQSGFMTVDDALRTGVSSAGSDMNWDASVTDWSTTSKFLDSAFKGIGQTKNGDFYIDTDSISADNPLASAMEVFVNASNERQNNAAQIEAAKIDIAETLMDQKPRDLLAGFHNTATFRSKVDKPVSDGGYLDPSGQLDTNAIMNDIYRVEKDKDGNEIAAGWLPNLIERKASKYRNESDTSSAFAKPMTTGSGMRADSQVDLMLHSVIRSGGVGTPHFLGQSDSGQPVMLEVERGGQFTIQADVTDKGGKALGLRNEKGMPMSRRVDEVTNDYISIPGMMVMTTDYNGNPAQRGGLLAANTRGGIYAHGLSPIMVSAPDVSVPLQQNKAGEEVQMAAYYTSGGLIAEQELGSIQVALPREQLESVNVAPGLLESYGNVFTAPLSLPFTIAKGAQGDPDQLKELGQVALSYLKVANPLATSLAEGALDAGSELVPGQGLDGSMSPVPLQAIMENKDLMELYKKTYPGVELDVIEVDGSDPQYGTVSPGKYLKTNKLYLRSNETLNANLGLPKYHKEFYNNVLYHYGDLNNMMNQRHMPDDLSTDVMQDLNASLSPVSY